MKKILAGLVAGLVLTSGLSSCGAQRARCRSCLADLSSWHPDLGQPIEQLEEILKKAQHQQIMNYTVANLGLLYDAELYMLFARYVAQLPPSLRAREIAQQRKWLRSRKVLVQKGYKEYEGGTLGPYQAGLVFVDVTRKRIRQIEARLKTMSFHSGTAPSK